MYFNLATSLNQLGSRAEALAVLDAAHEKESTDGRITLLRNEIAALELLQRGTVLHQAGRLDHAITCYSDAIALNGGLVQAQLNLGVAFKRVNRLDEAIATLKEAIKLKPDLVAGLTILGNILMESGQPEEATAYMEKAAALQPDDPAICNDLGIILLERGLTADAMAQFNKALLINPDHLPALSNLGNAMMESGMVNAAVEAFKKAVAIDPDQGVIQCNLGSALIEQGRMNEGVAALKGAMEIAPHDPSINSIFLFAISYHLLFSPGATMEHHQNWDRLHGKNGAKDGFRHPAARRTKKILHIGYVSADFRRHPVYNFITGVIAAHDPGRVRVHCYSNVASPDAHTAKIRSHAAVWRDIAGLNDAKAARLIHDDDIDILIDLAGHTKGNRLGVFTYKPAPVQVSYLGYVTTTGLQAMDYWLTDGVLTPEESVEATVEAIYRLPGSWVCYRPLQEPPVELGERGGDGAVVFGSFNHLVKIAPAVVALWSRILSGLPEAKLLLKTKLFADALERRRIMDEFLAHGIDSRRLILVEHSATYMADYSLIDVALDPFPRTGGVTTADALWMGVPVITLAGERMIERQGASLLTAIGRDEWIAANRDEYVQKALELGKKGVRNSKRRRALHAAVAASPLCDARKIAGDLETAYQNMWSGRQI